MMSASTSFSIHPNQPAQCVQPIAIRVLEGRRGRSRSLSATRLGNDEVRAVQLVQSEDGVERAGDYIHTDGDVTTFEAMPPPNGQQPLRIPQPPQSALHARQCSTQSLQAGARFRHCGTPSTSSVSSVTTFPAAQPSCSSLPPYSAQPSPLAARKPPAAAPHSTSTLPHRRPAEPGLSRQQFGRMSYNELMDLAKRQQLQLEAQRAEFAERRRHQDQFALEKRAGLSVPAEVERLRAQIREDEAALQRQTQRRRDLDQLRAQQADQRHHLRQLEQHYQSADQSLRHAAHQVLTLRQRVEQLQQRRAAAANAAIAQQRKLNGTPAAAAAAEPLYGQIQKPPHLRPKAQVGPFQIQHPALTPYGGIEKPPPPAYDQVDAVKARIPVRPVDPAHRLTPKAGVENPWVLRTPAVDAFSLRNDSLKATKRRSWAQVDQVHHQQQLQQLQQQHQQQQQAAQLQPQPAQPHKGEPPVAALRPVQKRQDDSVGQSTGAQILRTIVEEQKKGKKQLSLAALFGRKKSSEDKKNKVQVVAVPPKPQAAPTRKEISRPLILDAPHAQPVNAVQPEPRRDLAPIVVPEADEDREPEPSPSGSDQSAPPEPPTRPEVEEEEAEESPQTVAVAHCREQVPEERLEHEAQRPDSLSPPEDPQTLQVQPAAASPAPSDDPPLSADETRMLEATKCIIEQLEQLHARPQQPQQHHTMLVGAEEDLQSEEEGVEIKPYVEQDEDHQTTTEETSSNDESVSTTDEIVFDDISRPFALKGILKPPNTATTPKKKMVFDPLVIFLDAALEGQLEVVRENALKIADISAASDEGITALHNAICASHIDIIRFLIQQHADVNAQDSDGWTPLHCAASCNNFPIAKMLVENGACVFATSLSDGETAAHKCEITIDGYGSCASFLRIVERCMGVINDRKVYTAYSHEAQHEDELSFAAGEELRVVEKDTGEQNFPAYHQLLYSLHPQHQHSLEESLWWVCENGRGARGLVPRNFLGIAPTWQHVERLGYQPQPLPTNELALDALLAQIAAPAPDPKLRTQAHSPDEHNSQTSSSANSDETEGSQRDQDSPPPLPNPQDFDRNCEISAQC